MPIEENFPDQRKELIQLEYLVLEENVIGTAKQIHSNDFSFLAFLKVVFLSFPGCESFHSLIFISNYQLVFYFQMFLPIHIIIIFFYFIAVFLLKPLYQYLRRFCCFSCYTRAQSLLRKEYQSRYVFFKKKKKKEGLSIY